ncbi:DUF4474 domain-containing protein [uncultured Psychroserpens sp.]|uniref:DUF4474 domain-containing protein n=1 Tax=uncultured Psychroserpens sp. TaxID=255436 RepID=UPI002602D11D|nr:DUF4474 domain-containing protein [uncultured Psychroserpens sp.]
MVQWQPTSALAHAIYLAGFRYDPKQDILYSRMYAIQRQLGYAYGYDAAAFMISANIDCEPIFFEYDNKVWMIELWKGQYGLETGCEIGIYNRNPNDHSGIYNTLDKYLGKRPDDPNPNHNLFYNCVGNDEMLDMHFSLYRDNELLFTRGQEKDWWLTGFKWGIYSEPEQLKMEVAITFPEETMLKAFEGAIKHMGYVYTLDSNSINFVFDRPKTKYQPRLHNPIMPEINEANKDIVAVYDSFDLPNNNPNTIPKELAKKIEKYFTNYVSYFETIISQAIKPLDGWINSLTELVQLKHSIVNQHLSLFLITSPKASVNDGHIEFSKKADLIFFSNQSHSVAKSLSGGFESFDKLYTDSISNKNLPKVTFTGNLSVSNKEYVAKFELGNPVLAKRSVLFPIAKIIGDIELIPNGDYTNISLAIDGFNEISNANGRT